MRLARIEEEAREKELNDEFQVTHEGLCSPER